jgi:hypothetical protein
MLFAFGVQHVNVAAAGWLHGLKIVAAADVEDDLRPWTCCEQLLDESSLDSSQVLSRGPHVDDVPVKRRFPNLAPSADPSFVVHPCARRL